MVCFDNSPAELARGEVAGKTVLQTTPNGTAGSTRNAERIAESTAQARAPWPGPLSPLSPLSLWLCERHDCRARWSLSGARRSGSRPFGKLNELDVNDARRSAH